MGHVTRQIGKVFVQLLLVMIVQDAPNTMGEAASETKLLGDQPIPPVGKPLWLAEARIPLQGTNVAREPDAVCASRLPLVILVIGW